MRAVAALLAGVLHAWAMAWPWGSGLGLQLGQPSAALQVLSLAALAALLWPSAAALSAPPSFLRGFSLGWAFAWGWLGATFWWLFISMHTYGGLAAPLAALAVAALAGLLSIYYGLAAGLWVKFFTQNSKVASEFKGFVAIKIVAFASLWMLAELARARLFTGFPWGAGGYAHVDGTLAALAPWVGVYGMGWVAAVAACTGAAMLMKPAAWRTGVAWAGVSTTVALAWPGLQAPSLGAPVSVALLQGNIAQHEKFVRVGVQQALDFYVAGVNGQTAQLVIAPETALPMLPRQLPDGVVAGLQTPFKGATQRAALLGVPLTTRTDGYTNSVIGLQTGQPLSAQNLGSYRYDKHHLVPFGEFIPPFFKWFVRLMHIPLGDFDRGDLAQAPFEFAGERFAPNICYEDLFGEEMAASFADPASAPTVMVNFSNIGWFGNGIAIDQHLHISRMRALEFARPMLRATNTGATGLIDHTGRVVELLPRATPGVLQVAVRGASGAPTPYAQWASRLGVWPLALLAGLVVLVGGVFVRRP